MYTFQRKILWGGRMRKETFLNLCGERDKRMIAGETPPTMDDLLRLEYLAGLLGCLEVGLSMYFARHEQAPAAEGERNPSVKVRWRQQFLCDAPNGETLERIYRLMKQKGMTDFPP